MGTQAFIDPAERGHLIGKEATSKETIDGNRNIFIDGDMAFMEQLAPSYKEIDHRLDRLISSLGIAGQDLLSNHKPIIVNTGNSFSVVPLKDETMVAISDEKVIIFNKNTHPENITDQNFRSLAMKSGY